MKHRIKRIRNISSTNHGLRFASEYRRHAVRYPNNTIKDKGYISYLRDNYIRRKRGD